MTTYNDMINSVLIRMREPTVATPGENDYSLLIGEFVNESKREVEDAWKWNALRTTVTVTTADGVNNYAMTVAGRDMSRWKLQHPKLSVYNVTNLAEMTRINSLVGKRALLGTTDKGQPEQYYFEGANASGDPLITFFRVPDAIYSINVEMVLPESDFTSGGEIIKIPHYPVMLSAYAKAIAERGEDNGNTHGEALQKAQLALADAIAIDVSLGNRDDWEVE